MAENAMGIHLRRSLLLTGALAFCASGPLADAMEWATTEESATIRPFQTSLQLRFPFRNDTTRPVRILDIQTNCDCTTAQTDKTAYAPGETGVLTATFTVGDRFGRYERLITILASDDAKPTRLKVIIDAPELATATPRTLNWTLSAAPQEQATDIMVAAGLTLQFTEVVVINDRFLARLETVATGRHYRLHIRPVSTTAIANAAIRVLGRDDAGHEVVVSAYANVH